MADFLRLVKRSIAIEMLQAQVATGGVLSPKNGDKVDIRTAVQTGLVPNDFEIHLIEAEKAFKGRLWLFHRENLTFRLCSGWVQRSCASSRSNKGWNRC